MTTKLPSGHWMWRLVGLALACLVAVSARAGTNQYVSLDGTAVSPYTNWTQAATNLAQALAATADGNTIIVSNGIYWPTNGSFIGIGKSITITSLYGAAQTVINGGGQAPGSGGIYVGNTVTSTIYGLTVTNWTTPGIFLQAASACLTVVNCISAGNRNTLGGGINVNGGTLVVSNCVIRGNTASATSGGGGVYIGVGTGTLVNCEISGNGATNGTGGGIMAYVPITVRNCTITGNTGKFHGGGVYLWTGSVLENCTIVNNRSLTSYGGGIYGSGWVKNCLIACNTADISGGVWLVAPGGMYNCTIVSNTAFTGGGGFRPGTAKSEMVNTIVYFNTVTTTYPQTSNFWDESKAAWTNCCTAPSLGVYGTHCITEDPNMANRPADCRLLKGSLCINTGYYLPWMDTARDVAGRQRIRQGAVDMGAYEYFPVGTVISFH